MAWDSKTPSIVTRARLLNSSPSAVIAELKEYATYHVESHSSYDEKLEEALMLRNDRLINLGLAQYGASRKIATVLYRSTFESGGDAEYNKGLRLAVLGNPYLPESSFGGNTFGILTDAEVLQFITSDSVDDESALRVIITNPGAKKLLAKLYNQETPFDTVPEVKFLQAVYWSYSNSAINADGSDLHGPDMDAWSLQKGIKNLLTALPADDDGLLTAYSVLKFLNPRRVSSFDQDPTPIFKRWQSTKLSEKFQKRDYGYVQDLDLNEEFPCLLASLYYWYSKDGRTTFIGRADSPEKYLRCAHYAHAKMTADEMQAAYDKDGDAFTLAALNNEPLFWEPATRGKLEELMRWRLIHRYQRRCEQIKAKHPQFDLPAVTEHGAALLEEMVEPASEIQKRLGTLEQQLAVMSKQLQSNSKVLLWLLIVLVVAVVLIWRPHS